MASSALRNFFVLIFGLSLLFFTYAPTSTSAHPFKACQFDQIYQLGDSISDTGNLIREFPVGASTPFARPPYGETFFKNATGRCSNGLLMIDYIAMAVGLPLLSPYKNIGDDFSHGVNFAVAGSTALPSEDLTTKHNISSVTTSSLSVQLDWMSNYFDSTCLDDRDCVDKLKSALFMVGEIGGNDYNYAILREETMDELKSMINKETDMNDYKNGIFHGDRNFQGKAMRELDSIIHEVVNTTINVVKKVIDFGATRVVVPGNIPIGCLPIYQTIFQTNNSEAYDANQCLKQFNVFAMYHNVVLQAALFDLEQEKPNAIIVYGDYYNAYEFLLQFAKSQAFDTQKACCGIGGEFNFNMTRMCGAPGVPVCEDPHHYISWDGVHLTQEGNKIMAGWLLNDLFTKLQCPI